MVEQRTLWMNACCQPKEGLYSYRQLPLSRKDLGALICSPMRQNMFIGQTHMPTVVERCIAKKRREAEEFGRLCM